MKRKLGMIAALVLLFCGAVFVLPFEGLQQGGVDGIATAFRQFGIIMMLMLAVLFVPAPD